MKMTVLATIAAVVLLGGGTIAGCTSPSSTSSQTTGAAETTDTESGRAVADESSASSMPSESPSPAGKMNKAEVPSSTVSSVSRMGQFVAAEHPTSGTVRLITKDGKTFLEFDESFATNNGPDLYVVLHKSADVLAVTRPPAYGIREGDYVSLGRLQSIKGKQRYEVPVGVNLENFNSALVWCQQFNATFGTASLR